MTSRLLLITMSLDIFIPQICSLSWSTKWTFMSHTIFILVQKEEDHHNPHHDVKMTWKIQEQQHLIIIIVSLSLLPYERVTWAATHPTSSLSSQMNSRRRKMTRIKENIIFESHVWAKTSKKLRLFCKMIKRRKRPGKKHEKENSVGRWNL